MPALLRLIDAGVMGNLGSIEPILSPIIWTSIATGKLPHKHGVLGFAEPDPLGGGIRPVGSQTRQAKALWNILQPSGAGNAHGGVVCEPSRRGDQRHLRQRALLSPTLDAKNWRMPAGAVAPADFISELEPLRVHPSEITGNELLPFIPRR